MDPDGDLIWYEWDWGTHTTLTMIPHGSNVTVTESHMWLELGDYSLKVRATDNIFDNSRWSDWSEALQITVTKRIGGGNDKFVSPDDHIDNTWKNEKRAYDGKPYISFSKYNEWNDFDWCDNPLILTLDEPIVISGYKFRASHAIGHDKMKVEFYNENDPFPVTTSILSEWPNKRFKEVYFDGSAFEVNQVKIFFQENGLQITHGFAGHPAKVWEFYFWQADTNGYGNPISHADAGGPYQGSLAQVIGFDGSGSIIVNGSVMNCTWDFGDGTYGYDLMVNHIYPFEKTFYAELTITDTNGNIYSNDTTVTIDSQSCSQNNGNSCFLQGTKITMADGSLKNIENVEEGDMVLAYDISTAGFTSSMVLKKYYHKQNEGMGLYLVINDNICVTPNHLLNINGDIMQVENARENDTLLKADGSNMSINSIYLEAKYVPTYNLGLESNTYMYVADEIVAHHLKPTTVNVSIPNSQNKKKFPFWYFGRESYSLPYLFPYDFWEI